MQEYILKLLGNTVHKTFSIDIDDKWTSELSNYWNEVIMSSNQIVSVLKSFNFMVQGHSIFLFLRKIVSLRTIFQRLSTCRTFILVTKHHYGVWLHVYGSSLIIKSNLTFVILYKHFMKKLQAMKWTIL